MSQIVSACVTHKFSWTITTLSARAMSDSDLKARIRDAEVCALLMNVGQAHKIQSFYSKATKAELARHYDQAYESYVRAAELFLHLSRSAQAASEKDRSKWKGNVQRALDRAEKIKGSLAAKPSSSLAPPPTGPPAGPAIGSTLALAPVFINHFALRKFHTFVFP